MQVYMYLFWSAFNINFRMSHWLSLLTKRQKVQFHGGLSFFCTGGKCETGMQVICINCETPVTDSNRSMVFLCNFAPANAERHFEAGVTSVFI